MRNIFKSLTISMEAKGVWSTYLPPYISFITWRGRAYTFTGNSLLNKHKAFKTEIVYDREKSSYV